MSMRVSIGAREIVTRVLVKKAAYMGPLARQSDPTEIKLRLLDKDPKSKKQGRSEKEQGRMEGAER